jgi:multicomponent Na+:H+ antiporter subunit A
MTFLLLSGFVLAFLAPWLHRHASGRTGWLLALLPLVIALYLGLVVVPLVGLEGFSIAHEWMPSLGVTFSLYLDGLSVLFALIISAVGVLVLIYAGGYLHGHEQLGRFFAYLVFFMASMLGLVMADNLILLFIFWELTSISSYLLIGFEAERRQAREAALQALLVTGGGGLALLAGLVLLGYSAGSFELSVLLANGDRVREHHLYVPILLLVLVGAFTKSAQFPFHFWLPSAMEAPTPVSAYLHSATMVKAGVYLLARLSPVLADTQIWFALVATFGATTMVLGAWLALQHREFKSVLAYSTVSVLGTLTMLLGIGEEVPIKAALVYLFGHTLYKGALFLVAGAVDHETGTRNIDRLGGLRSSMPIVASAALLAALSMAGVPPLVGYIGKEMFYEATLASVTAATVLTGLAVLTSIMMFAIAVMVGIRPFFGESVPTPKHPHEPPVSLWLGPVVLAGTGLLVAIAPGWVAEGLAAPAAAASLGRPVQVDMVFWHGFNMVLALTALTVVGGAGLYVYRARARWPASWAAFWERWGASSWYFRALDGLNALATGQTRILQNGYLRFYVLTTVVAAALVTAYPLLFRAGPPAFLWKIDVNPYEAALGILIVLGAVAAVRARSRLAAVAALGVVGYGVALIFMLFAAPDLAMTQFLIETLIVIIFVFVFYRLPRFGQLSSPRARFRDAVVALIAGGVMTVLVLAATAGEFDPAIQEYYAEYSVPLAHGRNIVNVILVDFRAFDTLGEITVLAVAGIGVYSLLRLRLEDRRKRP